MSINVYIVIIFQPNFLKELFGRKNYTNIFKYSESEFNEFKTRLKSPKKPVLTERRLKSWTIEYNFKWNQPYLSRGLNLTRGSNSLNSTSVYMFHK